MTEEILKVIKPLCDNPEQAQEVLRAILEEVYDEFNSIRNDSDVLGTYGKMVKLRDQINHDRQFATVDEDYHVFR